MISGGKVAFHTLGCKLNFSETSTVARQLSESGFARVSVDEKPNVVVINTCSVTDSADSKCRNFVRRSLKGNPLAYIVVIGCYAQLKPEEIAAIEGVDLVLGANEKFNLPSLLDNLTKRKSSELGTIKAGEIKEVRDFIPGFSSGDRTRTFLKVQDGCDYFCAFCTIPLARGRSRSGTIEQTLIEARKAIDLGAKEIVLTGVNIGDFGKANGESLLELITELDKLEGIERYRISSIEPNLLTEEIIDFVASSDKFQPHFHIPLQSGSDEILSSMRRRYRTDLYRSRIEYIREKMPLAGIGVDVIVGFPGECDSSFQETYDFIKSLSVSYLHVFTYSERPKTTALRIDDVIPVNVRQARNKQLRILSLKKQRAHYENFLGSSRKVLIESAEDEGLRFGYTPEYVRVAVRANESTPNSTSDILLETINPDGFVSGITN
ncbi:MAG TPA: tRNA (N(6)-L-threonylcarbamoyladenosine(37)-C(2))-methylthiotransferase MtaB [Flavobacteriales bacterium]|nr:tRNA (N(6)-L-threonylcarbamoyladenosine(37)-C(2))-methylthiotransferase MtaB [Flavobacteriales bacterium]HIB77387.1 tRNA (N(6)-L-threonylcarbamoyladenosine(37)-C(2))-methylthiotransferase MtaB [Flavobacteriales bacterium]HIN42002.1 tRNA (N(6)-L-threonylcarbamoyladenosine(37)-C(2))-methylthiotransferase MtaB [Flavobacteriales bacterium]HIO15555.1 tRNA (N(6)-L-threonylcarbamoyladenosine(37)-C(2))-methylthiotransferase MtaB [Flavobacteriales bacterium]HIO59420.1 tRNA (N(6)-L-threonylcarbamoylad